MRVDGIIRRRQEGKEGKERKEREESKALMADGSEQRNENH